MAIFTTNTRIGTTDTEAQFASHRVWAGGTATYQADQDFVVNSAGATVRASDCTIVARNLNNGTNLSGAIDFNNVSLLINPSANTAQAGVNLTWDNVTMTNDSPDYRVIGNWAGAVRPTYAWNDVTLSGAIVQVGGLVGFNLYIAGLTAASVFNNVSFWNGLDWNNSAVDNTDFARGAILQGSPILTWSQPTFAPAGTRLNNSGAATNRMLMRFAIQNTPNNPSVGSVQKQVGGADESNHWTPMLSADSRAWSQMITTNDQFIAMDGADVWFVNPLIGNPGEGAASQIMLVPLINGGNDARFRYLVGSNPVTTNGGTQHWYTFTQAFDDRGIYEHPTAVDTLTPLIATAGPVLQNMQTGFIVDIPTTPTGTYYNTAASNTNDIVLANAENLIAPGNVWYRKASWLQQPDNTTFHRRIDVGVADGSGDDIGFINNGVDTQPFINNGYDTSSATGFETETNVDDPIDLYITETGFATVANATAAYDGAAVVRAGSHIAGQLKELAILDAIVPDAANNQVPLPYSFNGLTIDVGARTLNIGSDLTRSYNASTANIKATRITADDFITAAEATTIELSGTGWNTTDEKISFIASDTFNAAIPLNTITATAGSFATAAIDNGTLIANGTAASTVGNISNTTLTANSLAPATVLTVGNIADSIVSTTGTLTTDANNFSGINTLSAGSFTSLETTANSLSNLTLRGDYIFTGTDSVTLNNVDWNTGTYTLPSTAVITGDSDFNGTINIPANGVYTVIGAEASINTAATLNFAGDADITFQDGATEQTFFGGRTLPSDVELITSPLIVTLTNNGLGNQYFNLTDDSDNFIDSSRYILAGESTDANGDPFIEVGDSITIQIAVTDINQEVWGLYVVGEGVVDSTFGIQYDGTVLAMDLAAAVDTNYNTGDIANRLDGWELIDRPAERLSVSGFDTGTLNGEYSRVTGADIPTFTGFDPDGSQNTPVAGSIVYRRPGANAAAHRYVWNRADTTTTQGGWHISAADATANAWAFGYVNRTVLTPQTDNLFSADTWFTTSGTAGTNPSDPQGSAEIIDNTFREFGITIPSGQVAYGNRINSTVGQFKSNKQYADYVAKNGVGNGITFNGVDRTQFYYNGPEVGDVNHETEYSMGMRVDGGTNIQALSAFHPDFPNWRIKQFRMGWKTADNTSYDTDEPGFFRDIANPSDATDIREFVFTNANFNAAFGATDEIIRGLQFVLRVVNADGTLTRIGSGNQYFRMFDTTNAPPTQTTPTNLTVGGAYGSNTAPTSYLRSFIIAWDPVLFDGVAGIGDNGTPGFGYTNDANPVELRFDRVLSTAVQGSSVPTRTYMDIDVTGTATPVRASGVEYLIQDAGGNDDLVLNVGNDDWPQTGSIDGTSIDRGNINLSIVDGQSISIYPNDESGNPILSATPESQVLDMRTIESDVVDYATIQARTISALGEAGVSTSEEVEDVGAQVDNNNTRLQSINSGDASKIPTRRDYDPNSYTPDSII